MGALVLSLFVLWLVSFPMVGFLLGKTELLPYFLIPHTAGLTGWFFARQYLLRLAPVFTGMSAVLTAVYPHMTWKELTLVSLGFFSSATAVYVGYILQLGGRVGFLGLAFGNLFALLLSLLPADKALKHILISLGLLVLLYFTGKEVKQEEPDRAYYKLLPFFFTFYAVGGIMYKAVMELYMQGAYFYGVEVSFYILAVILSFALVGRFGERPLVILSSLTLSLAFLLLQVSGQHYLNAGMFLLQSGFGFADFLLLYTLYSAREPLRAYPLGFSAVCAGIIAGYYASLFKPYAEVFTGLGNLAILLSLLYYFSLRKKSGKQTLRPSEPSPAPQVRITPEAFLEELQKDLPETKKRLSKRELEVLSLLLEGCSYESASERTGLSSSSVREYTRRGLEKLGISKEELCNSYSRWLSFQREAKHCGTSL